MWTALGNESQSFYESIKKKKVVSTIIFLNYPISQSWVTFQGNINSPYLCSEINTICEFSKCLFVRLQEDTEKNQKASVTSKLTVVL